MLTKRAKIQLAAFSVVVVISVGIMAIFYVGLPAMLFGIGRYTVKMELDKSGNLYPTANVTYRGTTVGRVESVRLTEKGVEAELSLNSSTRIPSDLSAEVHSQTAVGEQYVALLPRNGTSAALKDGDVIPIDRTSEPPNLNSLLDATNKGLLAIPNDNLQTVIDESYTALGGLGPEFARFVDAGITLSTDARKDMGSLNALIDNAGPVGDSQADTADSIQAWAAHLATITKQLQVNDQDVAGVLQKGGPATDQVRQLFDQLNPTLPTLLANLISVGQVAVVYQNNIEQLLVLIPQGVANLQGTAVANLNTKQAYQGVYLSFNLNLNLPPPCNTGFLPIQQQRAPSLVDAPDKPAGDLYCRTPQDSEWNVRGARNIPCETVPGKRAPTVKMCESNENYVPLNDGFNWKGDPNATLSGQGIPQAPPGSAPPGLPPPHGPPVPPIAAAEYDPVTGSYVGPDGQTYTQRNLAATPGGEQTWQNMLVPPQARP